MYGKAFKNTNLQTHANQSHDEVSFHGIGFAYFFKKNKKELVKVCREEILVYIWLDYESEYQLRKQ